MATDLFRKLCFGVKFSTSAPKHNDFESKAPTQDTKEASTGAPPVDGRVAAPVAAMDGKKKRRRKKQGSVQHKAQQVNELKNRHRIHTEGDSVADPVTQFSELQERYSLHAHILNNVQRAGFTAPTPVQMQAIPVMMEGRDILVGAPTGSGKTAAFVIPVLHHLRQPDTQGIRALILAPTRELARQTLQVCRQLSEGIGFRCHYIDKEAKALKFGPQSKKSIDVLVSTPNRLVYMLKRDPPLIDLSRVQWLVVDESDKLFEDGETGFQEQLAVIDNACSGEGLRHAFFSATFSQDVQHFCQSTMHSLVQVNVGARNAATHLVKQELLFVGSEAGKRIALRNLISEGIEPPVLIFVQSKQRAKELYSEFMFDSVKMDVIHADKPQAERDATVANFVSGKVWALVCTELMGRGIDFKGINLVINYDFPTNTVSYIHRIGRTGRAGVAGRAVTFFTEQDATHLRSIANIMKQSGCEVPDYMLKLKKPSKKEKKRKFPVKRKRITTELHDSIRPAKRRMVTADQSSERASDGENQPEETHPPQKKAKKHRSSYKAIEKMGALERKSKKAAHNPTTEKTNMQQKRKKKLLSAHNKQAKHNSKQAKHNSKQAKHNSKQAKHNKKQAKHNNKQPRRAK